MSAVRLLLPRGRLLAGDRALTTFPGSGIRFGALTADRQALPVAKSTITTDIAQALDVQMDLGTQHTLDDILVLDYLTNAAYLVLGPFLSFDERVDLGLTEYLLGT